MSRFRRGVFFVGLYLLKVAEAPTTGVPLEKRGPRAWDNFYALPTYDTTRLLIHSVSDASSKIWLPKLLSFLTLLEERGWGEAQGTMIDRLLARRLDEMCYGERLGYAEGQALVSGLVLVAPELRNVLKRAYRSLLAWKRLNSGKEGEPVPEELVWLIAHHFFTTGDLESGIITLVSFDGYLRSEDWHQLFWEDLFSSGGLVGCVFGVSDRGMSVKGGTNQGLVFSRGVVAEAIWALRGCRSEGEKLFRMSQFSWRRKWAGALEALELPFLGPPHSLRHAGPSEDLQRGRRTLIGIQRRGRWKFPSSVARYTKTHILVAQRSQAGTSKVHAGAEIQHDPRRILADAVRSSKAHKSQLGRNLLHVWGRAIARDHWDEDPMAGMSKTTRRYGDLKNRTLPELKMWCRARGLPVSGAKSDVIDRLLPVLERDDSADDFASDGSTASR